MRQLVLTPVANKSGTICEADSQAPELNPVVERLVGVASEHILANCLDDAEQYREIPQTQDTDKIDADPLLHLELPDYWDW